MLTSLMRAGRPLPDDYAAAVAAEAARLGNEVLEGCHAPAAQAQAV